MRIGFDLDGCTFDFAESLRRYLVSRYDFDPERLATAPQAWSFYESWGLSEDDFVRYCHQGVRHGELFANVGTMDVMDSRATKQAKAAGHEVVIVTARGFGGEERARALTEDWLFHEDFVYDELHLAKDKTSVPTDFFLEDNAENYLALSSAGVCAYLMDQPWNRGTRAWDDALSWGKLVRSYSHYVDQVLMQITVDEALAA